jgi:hypothetical protein
MEHIANTLHKDFIAKFGATSEAAAAFGVPEVNIRSWRLRGIPSHFWPMAEQIAKRRKWGVSAADLAAAAPQPRRRSQVKTA